MKYFLLRRINGKPFCIELSSEPKEIPAGAIIIQQEYRPTAAQREELTKNLNYKEDRAKEYPSIGDQLDMLWHSMDSGTAEKVEPFYSTIKTIKEKYPKS